MNRRAACGPPALPSAAVPGGEPPPNRHRRQDAPPEGYVAGIRPSRTPLVLALAILALAAPAAHASYHGRIESSLSAQRAERGLAPLRVSPSLSRSSGRYASYLARTDRFAHAAHLSISHSFWLRGENLALFPRRGGLDAGRVVAAWMASPEHRENILNPRFRYVGVSGRYRADGELVWVAHFGAR